MGGGAIEITSLATSPPRIDIWGWPGGLGKGRSSCHAVDPEHLVGEGKEGGVTYGKRGLGLHEGAAGHQQQLLLLARRDSPAPVLTFAIQPNF